ncbi:MAG: CHRD domain-containing protein [Bacteroidales bacterium]|nr:CHRD domain-containing protein [Bacteroidales bacterium]
MKTRLTILAVAAIFVFASCERQFTENDVQPKAPSSAEVQNESDMLKSGHQNQNMDDKKAVLNFRTHLSGDNEVPDPVETNATGQAVFQLSKDGMKLHYKLIVANIKNVYMAHIHVGSADENGPVVAWLYPPAPPPALIEGRTQGVLQEGVITKDDLVGQLEGEELWDLVEMMKNEHTYVNVHTNQYPAGEIRGQIMGGKNMKGNQMMKE